MKKAAIIGFGTIAPVHLAAIRSNPEIELCAVCDTNEAVRISVPEGVPFYTDYKALCAQAKPDCVHICLPHYLHFPVSQYFAEQGVHVFCEKPVALTPKQAEEFAALAQTATAHIFWHRTYCNHVNAWIARAGLEELSGITYGAALPDDLAQSMAEIMAAVPGVYAFVGSGSESVPGSQMAHHTPGFDVDERAIPIAASLYVEFALARL